MELVVKTLDGTPVTHDVTKNTVRLKTPDGESVDFVAASDVPVAVEETVELDFSGGDMVVTPEDGQTFSGVNIPIPDNLLPENIAEGVDIAGIVGTLAAGVGEIKAKGMAVQMEGASNLVITHDLGVVPDIVIVACGSHVKGYPTALYGISSALYGKIGTGSAKNQFVNRIEYGASGGYPAYKQSTNPIDTSELDSDGIKKANASTITIGSTTVPFYQPTGGAWYYILLIGGLT